MPDSDDSTVSPQPKLSVVVPLYNEEDNVLPMIEELHRALEAIPHELVLVDDGSTDGTAGKIPLKDPTILFVRFAANTGQSAAMYAGVHAATGEIIAFIDGDLQNDPADIPKLIEELERGADLACGYRASRKDTAFKRGQSRIANFVRSRFTGDGVRDTGCTLKAMKRPCRDALVPFTGMHRFIPALIKGAGFKVVELPVNHRARQHGVSKYGFGNRAMRATMDMFGVKWLLSRRFSYKINNR
ncbi:MAG: glycosyltransferase family 2 protein [Verrucomicrobia bacterium]|nr:glycosyltransferase family 2 protein [Verrucomicrobiota bacterium]